MTRWPCCLAEIALYAVVVGIAIGMGLDARARFRQLRQRADTAAGRDAEHNAGDAEHDAGDAEHDPGDGAPPPLAS